MITDHHTYTYIPPCYTIYLQMIFLIFFAYYRRPGRVDVIQSLNYASTHQMHRIWAKFFPDKPDLAEQFTSRLRPDTLSMAYLQNYLMSYRDDPDAAIENTTRIFNKHTAAAPVPRPAVASVSGAAIAK